MGRITVICSLTLDGVAQAPGRPDEDLRGDFGHGGWALPYNDEVMGARMGAGMAQGGALLLGRRTYESLFAFWPKQTDGNPFTEVLDRTTKYVASTTLTEPLPWVSSTLLHGDVPQAVAALKQEPGPEIAVIGSVELVRSLMPYDLVDAYELLIHPLVLGTGRRLFTDPGTYTSLHLVDSVTTTTGVVIARYEPAR